MRYKVIKDIKGVTIKEYLKDNEIYFTANISGFITFKFIKGSQIENSHFKNEVINKARQLNIQLMNKGLISLIDHPRDISI